ncbi:hypothetical protein Tco_1527435, partial [Tanacetum coccineum]
LPKIDPKDKGKKKIEEEDESETESEGQEEEREKFTVEERAKFLYDTIAAQRRFLAQQRSEAIRNKPPTKNQLRNQMMTYLKHIKRSDENERMIKEMNEKVIDSSKIESVKEEGKEEEGTKKIKSGHIKMIARKKPRKQSDDDSDDEHRKWLKIVTFKATIDSEIMEKKSVIARLNKILHIFDRQDLFHLYELMMEQYSEITLEGYELILWGDLKIMMESSTEGNEQKFEDGIVIHMLVERRYPLSKDLLQRMIDLGLEVERESSVALDLIRFIKQQIDEE